MKFSRDRGHREWGVIEFTVADEIIEKFSINSPPTPTSASSDAPPTPFEDVVSCFSTASGAPFDAAPNIRAKKLRIKLRDVSLGAASDIVCRLADLKVESEGEKNVFKAR